jgi:hypothetical protein
MKEHGPRGVDGYRIPPLRHTSLVTGLLHIAGPYQVSKFRTCGAATGLFMESAQKHVIILRTKSAGTGKIFKILQFMK